MEEYAWTIRGALYDALPPGVSLRGKTQDGHPFYLESTSVIISNLPYGIDEADMVWPLITFGGIIPDAIHAISNIAGYSLKPIIL